MARKKRQHHSPHHSTPKGRDKGRGNGRDKGTRKGPGGEPRERPAHAPRPGSRKARAQRREDRRTRVKGALSLAGGVVLVLFSLVLVLGVRPGQVAEERAFRTAVPCDAAAAGGAAATGDRREDCLRTEEATVQKVRIETAGKSTYREARLLGPGPVTGKVDFGETRPLLERLRPGDEVQAVVWRGEVVELTAWGVRQTTTAHPVGDALDVSTAAVMASAAGVVALGFGWWAIRRRPPAPAHWAGLGVLLVALFVVIGVQP
ncbi:MerC domain-containing protein [Streptomyces vilmorinianum]|uniref:MerC domain-containing protein n=1 Tax=Streptomyces vilmorinianum TaxID=3051092 RepID=UPI0010FAE699|nr:DMT family transporter [Streptomyces vilmorinianum]